MDNVVTWNVSQYAMMGILLGFFGLIGFRRGIRRELITLVGIGLAVLIVTYTVSPLVPQVNRFHRLAHFALNGGLGAENPGDVWEQTTQGLPPLVSGRDEEQVLGVLLFLLLIFLAYIFGNYTVPPPYSLFLRVIGFFAGMFNGFLVAIYLLPTIFPEPRVAVTLPGAEVQATLTSQQAIARAIALFVFVMIALGLYSASQRGGPPRRDLYEE